MMSYSLLSLLFGATLLSNAALAFAPHYQMSIRGMETSFRLFSSIEEELEGVPDEGGEALAAEFAYMERGHGLTEKDYKDLENDDLDPENLVVREDVLKDGTKLVDIEFTEDEDYSSNRSVDE